jgi:hypothetical protein
MKKLFLALFSTIVTTISFAQTINFGIKAGLNLSEFYRNNSITVNNSNISGFNAGGIVNIDYKNFSIQPGIFYSTKGEKMLKL